MKEHDYAKWMLEDPRVNFAISTCSARAGVDHLGIQAGERRRARGDPVASRAGRRRGHAAERRHLLLREERQVLDARPAGNRLGVVPHPDSAPVYGEDTRAREIPLKAACCARRRRNNAQRSFLCTGNSARSILAEAYSTRRAGDGSLPSAGSHPTGSQLPCARAAAQEPHRYLRGTLEKRDEFVRPDAPRLDFVFTVCDRAAGEFCPVAGPADDGALGRRRPGSGGRQR